LAFLVSTETTENGDFLAQRICSPWSWSQAGRGCPPRGCAGGGAVAAAAQQLNELGRGGVKPSRWRSASAASLDQDSKRSLRPLRRQVPVKQLGGTSSTRPSPSRYNFHLAARVVQLRLVGQRVVMAVQKAQADVLINRFDCALPGWSGAEGRREARGARREAREGPPTKARGGTARRGGSQAVRISRIPVPTACITASKHKLYKK
jgi:hypothetical protein